MINLETTEIMRKIHFLLTCLFLTGLSACQEDEFGRTNVQVEDGESLFTVSLSEPVVATRAQLGEPAMSTIENLHVLVFNEEGFFIANAEAKEVTPKTATTGTFKADLPISNRPCRLHFVANYDGYTTYTTTDTESTVLGSMVTTGNEDAYWGFLTVSGISDKGLTLDTPVPLLRNFAKITVKSTATDFTAESYTVYNKANSGLVAPYDPQDGKFADFGNLDATDPYGDFMTKNPDYEATTAGGVNADVIDAEEQWNTIGTSTYVYERNQTNSDIPAAILVKGRFGGSETPCYYKLDIVQFDEETYETTTYNLLRNFEYRITISEVKSEGYKTPQEAMYAAASNNLSASIQVSEVKRISSGDNTLEVSVIDTLTVKSEPLVITYSYTEGDNEYTADDGSEKVKINYELNKAAFSKIEVDGNTITLTPVSPLPGVMETQEIVIGTESGLTRRIIARVHEPFEFVAVDCQKHVAAKTKQEFTFLMELPLGLPTAAFPMTLTLDMKDNTLYPDVSKNRLPVNVTSPKNYTYDLVLDYNTYRQNRTVYCHFLTNSSSSATSITAGGEYFVTSDPVSFDNSRTPLQFGNVRLYNQRMVEGEGDNIIPFGAGQTATLQFTMNNNTDAVSIYTRYLENPSTSTGTITPKVNDAGMVNGYTYTPSRNGQQTITFTTKDYIAAETMELNSEAYKPALIEYANPGVNVAFTADGALVPDGRIVKVYNDPYYQEFVADLTEIENGQTEMRSFAGYMSESTLYFLYQDGSFSYRGSETVRNLTSKGGGTGKRITVTLTRQ